MIENNCAKLNAEDMKGEKQHKRGEHLQDKINSVALEINPDDLRQDIKVEKDQEAVEDEIPKMEDEMDENDLPLNKTEFELSLNDGCEALCSEKDGNESQQPNNQNGISSPKTHTVSEVIEVPHKSHRGPEYAKLANSQYRCGRCQSLTSSKKQMLRHIKHIHKNIFVTELTKKKKERLSKINGASRYIGMVEYAPVDKNTYQCNHCLMIIHGQVNVEAHIKTNHRTMTTTKCPYCFFETRYGTWSIKKHILFKHTDEKDINYFRCYKCDFKAKLKMGLRRHIETQHLDTSSNPKFIKKCPFCPKTFIKNTGLMRHVRRFHSDKPLQKLQCAHCSYECKSKGGLRHHLESRHMNIDKLETLNCQFCEFSTKFKAHMQAHVSTRHRRVLQCHICSYQCTIKQHMDLHLIGHKKNKNEKDLKYHCDKCDYKTYRGYSLKIHKLNHLKPEEIQYFYCYHCEFKAKRKDNLKSHIFKLHKKTERTFQCYICNFKVKKKEQLIRHIDKHSKTEKKGKTPTSSKKRR